jgi:integrase
VTDLRYLRHKRAKGRSYYYFDTGQRDSGGKPILTRLPDKRDLAFGGAYARALGARTHRANARAKGFVDLDELIRKYERSPEFKALAESSRRSYGRYLATANRLIRTTQGGSPAAAALEPRHVVQLRDTLADTPGAANQAVRALGALYAWASKPEQGHAKSNPAAKIALFKQGEHQPWPETLLEEGLADPTVRLPVALLYFTGQRIGDVVRMQWNDVEGGEIRVYAQKTRSRLWIALSGDLAALLSKAPRPSTAILTNEAGRPWTQSGLRQMLQAWALKRGEKIVPHGLRKNAVIALLEAGCTVAEVSAITAHSIAMVEHYAKGRNQRRIGRAAIVKLDDHRKARTARGV